MIVIPFSEQFTSFSEEIVLDDVSFNLQFDYNGRSDTWTLSIFDKDLIPLATGLRIVLGYELISIYVGRGLPTGHLFAADTTEDEIRVNRTNLGPIVALIYISESEFDTI